MGAAGYQSWFVSARDPASSRALWIRHTDLRPRQGPESAALWCTLVDRDVSRQPLVVKQVFAAPAVASAGWAARFQGNASMGGRTVRWELGVEAGEGPVRPLRPGWLYRAPIPRTKLEATVPDGLISGTVEIDGRPVPVSQWRGTIGHNWGSEHAESWMWLHAADFGAGADGWLELVLARVRIGAALSPWLAAGALNARGERFWLGGFGRRPKVDARPDRLAARIPSPAGWLELRATTADDDAVAVSYTDPSGGSRSVRHAALAVVDLTWQTRGRGDITLTTSRGAYEFGARHGMDHIELEGLPEG